MTYSGQKRRTIRSLLLLATTACVTVTFADDTVNPGVRHMWDCGMPKPSVRGAGFPILDSAERYLLYRATRETGGYSHHARLSHHGGRFFAMWSNHRFGEDNPGKPDHYGRDPLMVSVSPDGYLFARAYALRCGQQEWRIPRSEVRGRGGGGQYPSALVHGKHLYVLYSMGKEDVWTSRVPLADLGCDE
jgi:hypothetical protein